MSNVRAVVTRVALSVMAGGALVHQAAAAAAEWWMVSHQEPEWWRYVSPIPVPWLTLILAPVAVTAAALTVKKLRRQGSVHCPGTVLTSAFIASCAALVEVTLTPLVLFAYDLGEREFAWWMDPTLVVLTNGFLQGCVVSTLMLASAKARTADRRLSTED